VLAELAAQGVDMTQPVLIEFAVAAPDDASATAIGEALTKAGYDSQVEYDAGEPDEDGEFDLDDEEDDEEFGPSWTVFANVTMVPEYNEIMRIQADLDRLALPHGGQSDGWGVMIE